MIYRILTTFWIAMLTAGYIGCVAATGASEDLLVRANANMEQGQYFLALQEINTVLQNTESRNQQSRAYSIKGNILLLLYRYIEAEQSLLQAYDLADNEQQKASYANSLGILYHEMRHADKSEQYFKSALELAGNDSILRLKVKLNWMRSRPEIAQLTSLNKLLDEIPAVESINERIRLYINLASIAKSHGLLAHTVMQNALERARSSSADITDKHLLIEVFDSLAELYEIQGNDLQALELCEQASAISEQMDVDDLMINIEWRKGRIYQRLGRDDHALAAFGKAVDYIQAVRMDIPVKYEDGRSSFREMLEPIYLGYAHHLLKKSGKQESEAKQQTLLLARQTIEQIKQTELEDFLGGRCLIEGLQRNELDNIDIHAATLYPIILPDRLELLVGIGNKIRQYTVSVPENQVQEAAKQLAENLRTLTLSSAAYRHPAGNLYRWIIDPIEKDLASESIKILVIVPDGVLRLVPFAALFDGEHFLVEKYAISISPGMSLLGNNKNESPQAYRTLLAGLSKPGSVVEKLPASMINTLLQSESNNNSQRKLSGRRGILNQHFPDMKDEDKDPQNTVGLLKQTDMVQQLQEELSLPGVEIELSNLNDTLKNTTLLNEQFTVKNFYQQVSSKSYEIVHIATHGFFSSDVNKSFLMAYDDVLRLDDLKSFLRKNKENQQGIQLLTLSACQTAEGDDRAPLGFAGAALKAEAQSALGSLWQIDDEAASQLMESFYKNLMQNRGKAESLRRAQLELLKHPNRHHPSFWSPFILVGNWL